MFLCFYFFIYVKKNIFYFKKERQLQIELKKQRKALQDKIDKEYEKKQLDHIKGELLYEKMQEQKNKLKEIEAGKHIKEQILHNKELKKQMKKVINTEFKNNNDYYK